MFYCSYSKEGFSSYHLKKKYNSTMRNLKAKQKEIVTHVNYNVKNNIKKYLNLYYYYDKKK